MSPAIDSNRINAEETITRYILSSSAFSASNSRVKPRAFEPSPQDQSTSVFRIHGLQEDEVWEIGLHDVVGTREQTLYARADIEVSRVLSLDLSIRPDEPPARHALIYGWSDEKHSRMAKAQELAAIASLVLKP